MKEVGESRIGLDGSQEQAEFVSSAPVVESLNIFARAKVVKVERISLIDGSMTEAEMIVLPPFKKTNEK